MRSRRRTVAQDKVDQLLEAALDRPAAERSAFLASACGQDDALRGEVRSLLYWADRGGTTLEEPAARLSLAAPHLAPGSALGPFRVGPVLGEGGMGVVYRAADGHGRAVALKTVRAPGAPAVEGILREVQTLAAIRHPCIVAILDHGVADGLPWYAMELVEGESLRARLTALRVGRPLTGDALVRELSLVRRLCGALAYLHGEGVVHRDLKPDNVLVREDGMPVLMDFGLNVKLTGDLGREQLVVGGDVEGTVSYMAPEQAEGGVVDARADLYALGCLLFEVVAGRAPFVGTTLRETLALHRSAVPPRLADLHPDAPASLDRVVARLLSKDPRQRIGHAGVVAAVLGELGAEGEAEAAPKPYLYRPALVGRLAAIEALRSALGEVGAGGAVVACVTGESGGGKTRLLAEIATEARRSGMEVLVGECPGPEARALELLRGPLRRLAARCREMGREESERVFGGGGRLLCTYEPSIATLPGHGEHREPDALPPAAAELRLFRAAAGALDAARGRPQAPLLIVFDDVQWADEASLAFLAFLKRSGGLGRTLLVAACRVEEMPDAVRELAASPGVLHVGLPRLQAAEVGQMVSDMLAAPAPAEFVQALSAASEGNPFHVTEFVRVAIQEGWLTQDADGRWVAAAAQDERLAPNLPLPARIRELVRRQAARLPEETHRILQVASVLGREDAWDLLAAVAALDPAALAPHRSRLVGREILAESSGDRFRFRHDKIREAMYEELDAAARGQLHRAAAAALAATGTLEDDGRPRLARHWELAGEREPARAAYLEAARLGRGRASLPETRRLYESCLRLTAGGTEAAAVARAELAALLHDLGSVRAAETAGRQALEEARQLGLRGLEVSCLLDLARVPVREGCMEEALERLQEALQAARQLGDAPLLALALGRLGGVHHEMGHFPEAQLLYEEALARLPAEADLRGKLTQDLALLHDDVGHEEEARTLFSEAVALARGARNRRLEAGILYNMGRHADTYGRHDEAFHLTHDAVATMREIGDRWSEGVFLLALQDYLTARGDAAGATAAIHEALAIAREVGDARLEGQLHYRMAQRGRGAGDLSAAKASLDRAEALLRQGGGLKLARCYIERGHLDLAGGGDGAAALATARAYFGELRIEPGNPSHLLLAELEAHVETARRARLGADREAPPPG